jgi:ribosomal protein S18 acetylase RimI-like enzyme
VYKGSEPVAVSTLNSYYGISYISNIGSLQKVRGQGYGKAATLFCVNESLKRGDKVQCLATEEGNYPNEFYKRIGFKTKFAAPLFTKK